MNRIKITALSLSAILAMGAFSGCSKDKTPAVTTAATTESSAEQTTSTSEVTAETSAEASLAYEPLGANTYFGSLSSEDGNIIQNIDIQKNANIFISSFVEQRFFDYEKDYEDIDQRLDFAHMHLKINDGNQIGYEKKGDLSYETFSVEKARELVSRYFGCLLKDEDCNALPAPPSSYGDQPAGPYYENGKIWYQAADGESNNLIGIVDSAKDNGDGTLAFEFTVYSIDVELFSGLDGKMIDRYYRLSPEKASKDKTLSYIGKGTATVGVSQSGEFYLISYDT